MSLLSTSNKKLRKIRIPEQIISNLSAEQKFKFAQNSRLPNSARTDKPNRADLMEKISQHFEIDKNMLSPVSTRNLVEIVGVIEKN